MLLRAVAVISSSVFVILSTMLPLFLYTAYSTELLLIVFTLLILAAFLIHGVLTHALNDYTDHLSGTDNLSPAVLSGGSRVIQEKLITPDRLKHTGILLAVFLLILAAVAAVLSHYAVSISLVIGVWAAVSYSLPPLQLSYRPFLGEWLSLFPSILFLGFAGPWIVAGYIPIWTWQNALINAFFCLGWVMVHHIPDLKADQQAVPKKQTSVVWAVESFGLPYARLPALLYFSAGGLCAFWLGTDRLPAAAITALAALTAVALILKTDIKNHHQVTATEKILLLLAMASALSLGIFV